MNIMMVYDCLDEDPLVSLSWYVQLADSTRIELYDMVKDVLVEIQDVHHPWKALPEVSQCKY